MDIVGLWNFTKRVTVLAVEVMLTGDGIDKLGDVDTAGKSTDDTLKWDGANWVASAAEVNDLTAAVTWATVPIAYISSLSVTQHEGDIDHNFLLNGHNLTTDIDHDALTGFVQNEHATPKNSIVISVGQLQLDGDLANPGNTKLYGTNGSGVKGWYDQPSGGGDTVFGTEFDWEQSLGQSSTAGTTYLTKVSITTGTVPVGWYRIQATATIFNNDSDKRANARFLVEGTEVGELKQVGKNANDENPVVFVHYEQVTSPEVLTASLQYATGGDGGTAYIEDAIIEIWRVE